MHSNLTNIKQSIAILTVLALITCNANAQVPTEQSASTSIAPLVKLNVQVLDDAQRSVNDVNQNEFRVFENDVEQTIAFFSKDKLPLSYGLLVDCSGSLRSQFDEIIETGKRIVNANEAGDESFLMRFVSSEKIQVLQDFTSNKAALNRSLDQLFPEGGQTALIDAVFVAAMHLTKRVSNDNNQPRRQVLFLITDGEDRKSTSKTETLIDFLRKSNIQIHVIGLVSQVDNAGGPFGRKPPRGKAVDLLNLLAKETGGRAYFPSSSDQYPVFVDEMLRDIQMQYLIGYNPSPIPKSKSYRNVKVKIERETGAANRNAVTRPGYLVSSK